MPVATVAVIVAAGPGGWPVSGVSFPRATASAAMKSGSVAVPAPPIAAAIAMSSVPTTVEPAFTAVAFAPSNHEGGDATSMVRPAEGDVWEHIHLPVIAAKASQVRTRMTGDGLYMALAAFRGSPDAATLGLLAELRNTDQ